MLGAGMVAAIVCSLGFAWGLGEVSGHRHALEQHPSRAFHALYCVVIAGTAVVVALWPNLVALSLVVQLMNAFMLPLILGVLITLSIVALPATRRLRGFYLCFVITICAATAAAGLWGGIRGMAG
jgi:hypothetical protein